MAIYRIDNVERSGIGQYGEVIWNFPEAYNDAKDGDVLEIQNMRLLILILINPIIQVILFRMINVVYYFI